jgi:PIN domain nuclease of toxin-antitoxin system
MPATEPKMRLLLDTSTLLWMMVGDQRLSRDARSALADASNEAFVSVVTIWEIGSEVRRGKLEHPGNLLKDPHLALASLGLRDLPLTLSHSCLGGLLPFPESDRFDRMLAAQAMLENLILVSANPVFEKFAVARLW